MSADPKISHRFARRREALAQAATDAGAEAILVFGFGDALGAGTQSHGALRYLTGCNSHEAQSLLILTGDAAHLMVSSPFVYPCAEALGTQMSCEQLPQSHWAQAIAARIGAARHLGCLGFGELPQSVMAMIRQELPEVALISLDDDLARMRMIKDAGEQAALHQGAALCDDLFAALPQLLRRDDPVWKTQLRLEMQARMAGADYCRTWLTVRPTADRPRYWPEENRNHPGEGDQVLFGVALTVDGYWAHGLRMGSIGPASSVHQQMWSIIDGALSKGQAALRPHALLTDVEATMAQHVETTAMAAGWSDLARFRGGHGLGLSYEEPLLSGQFVQHWGPLEFRGAPPAPIPAQSGMVFELHPNLFIPNLGGAALGEMYLITDTGAQPMLRFPRQMFEA